MKTTDLYRLIWLTRPLFQQIEASVANALPAGLTVRMRAILESLMQHGPSCVPDVARHLDIQRQYVQVMMNEVEAAGYVMRQSNPAHKRSPAFALTPKGQSLIETTRTTEQTQISKIAAEISEDDIRTALRVAETLLASFRTLNLKAQP